MTTFVASLFLPYTVNFEPSDDETLVFPFRRISSIDIVNPFDQLHVASEISGNGGSSTRASTTKTKSDPPLPTDSPRTRYYSHNVSRTDTFEPRWGDGNVFNQPRSRARAAPSPLVSDYAGPPLVDTVRRYDSHTSNISGGDWRIEPAVQGNGGLKNAINAALDTGLIDHVTWVGTLGFPVDSLQQSVQSDIEEKLLSERDALTVFVSDNDFEGHYTHFCTRILWPVFHYQLPDHPKSKAYEDHSWEFFEKLNRAFADKISESYKQGDTIWIHDYHLMLVPAMLRQTLGSASIGFFFHVAFPSSEIFRCLARRKQLLQGILGADLVAFQTPEYANHFLQTCSHLLLAEATDEGLNLDSRFVAVTSSPIGIIPQQLRAAQKKPEVNEYIRILQDRYKGKRVILARDQLDAVRGVRQKLLSYEKFLQKFPSWRKDVVLIQVATPTTTETKDITYQVSEIAARIETKYSSLMHQPLVLLRQDITFPEYLALLSVADALIITSLRDGMNLTGHEFIICQGSDEDAECNPLILSEFTGSASILGENTLLVNPWDYSQCANAIDAALSMSAQEKRFRNSKLQKKIKFHDGIRWITELRDRLSEASNRSLARAATAVPRLSFQSLKEGYEHTSNRLFILDYEGTLSNWASPDQATFTHTGRIIKTLNRLILAGNKVYVCSNSKPSELDLVFRQVPRLGLIAEHGCFVRPFVSDTKNSRWTTLYSREDMSEWKEPVLKILEHYKERMSGASIEKHGCSITLHYGGAPNTDLDGVARQAGDCANNINNSCQSSQIRAVLLNNKIIVRMLGCTIDAASEWVFRDFATAQPRLGTQLDGQNYDFLLVAGNDREDEPLFQWAKRVREQDQLKYVNAVCIGVKDTEAMCTLNFGATALLNTLDRLTKP